MGLLLLEQVTILFRSDSIDSRLPLILNLKLAHYCEKLDLSFKCCKYYSVLWQESGRTYRRRILGRPLELEELER